MYHPYKLTESHVRSTWRGVQPAPQRWPEPRPQQQQQQPQQLQRLQSQQPRQQQKQRVLFPYALFNILNDDSNASWVSWDIDGGAFSICSWQNLISCLNDHGFVATQKASVIKNLLGYGFKRLRDGRSRVSDRHGNVWSSYRHEHFHYGDFDSLVYIERVGKGPGTSRQVPSTSSS